MRHTLFYLKVLRSGIQKRYRKMKKITRNISRNWSEKAINFIRLWWNSCIEIPPNLIRPMPTIAPQKLKCINTYSLIACWQTSILVAPSIGGCGNNRSLVSKIYQFHSTYPIFGTFTQVNVKYHFMWIQEIIQFNQFRSDLMHTTYPCIGIPCLRYCYF